MESGIKWLLLCAALALGEAAGFWLSRFAELWPLPFFAWALASLIGYGLGLRGWYLVSVFLLGFSLALLTARMRSRVLEGVSGHGSAVMLRLPVDEDARWNGVSKWASFPSRIGSVKLTAVFPRTASPELPRAGEVWLCRGWVERLDEDGISQRRRFWIVGSDVCMKKVSENHSPIAGWVYGLRRECSRRMGIGLESRPLSAALNRAILLGERGRLERRVKRAFADAGTIHIFAISGFHVMLVAGAIRLALTVFLVPLRFHGVVLVPVLWFYALMTGANPSAVRAAMMASLYFMAPLVWCRPDSVVSWAQTFLAMHISDPAKLHDIGSCLSFSVMLAVVLAGRFTARFISRRWVSAAVMTLAAWCAGTPIAAFAFGRFVPAGIFSNLLLVPAAAVGVPLALTGVLVSFVSRRLAVYVNNFAALVTEAMAGFSEVVAGIPCASYEVAPWPLWMCAVWYASMGLLLWWLTRVMSSRRSSVC
jgi:ComEC/Rec2-related protein